MEPRDLPRLQQEDVEDVGTSKATPPVDAASRPTPVTPAPTTAECGHEASRAARDLRGPRTEEDASRATGSPGARCRRPPRRGGRRPRRRPPQEGIEIKPGPNAALRGPAERYVPNNPVRTSPRSGVAGPPGRAWSPPAVRPSRRARTEACDGRDRGPTARDDLGDVRHTRRKATAEAPALPKPSPPA